MRSGQMILLVATATLALVFVPLPPSIAGATTAAMPSDFDGDGFADLAIAVPQEDPDRTGAVNVLYGSPDGLTAAGDQYWTPDTPGVKGTGDGLDRFGMVLTSGDFDRDGHADLAISSNDGINVLYGSATGLTAAGDQLWTVVTLSPLGLAWDTFGTSAAGDFDGDGFWDLALVGWGDGATTAAVILSGSPSGLTVGDATMLSASTTGIFPGALAAGDIDGDGYADLALGDPHAAVGAAVDAGVVTVCVGGADGVAIAGCRSWSQDSLGVPDVAESFDQFGSALAIGDLDADGFADIAIAAHWEDVNVTDDGSVAILLGSDGGLTAEGSQLWHQGVTGVPGVPQVDEQFGSSLAAGDFDGDGADDLAIGVRDVISGNALTGAVNVLYGGTAGVTAVGAQRWTQDSAGVPNVAERYDWFGSSLASADFGRSARDDLAVGVMFEDLHGVVDAGMVNVLYGRASGLSGVNAQGWSQNTSGVKGTAQRKDWFGASLTP